jgi:C-terminal processing protease CtpA/Prc
MQLRLPIFAFALAIIVIPPTPSRAQPPFVDDKDFTIAAAERDQLLDRIAKELQDAYVFPELADKMVADLKAKRSEYEKITSGPALAAKLTTNLQAISKDKHVRVRASATPFPKPPKDGPSAAERDRAKEFGRRMNGAIVKMERLPGNIGYLDIRNFMQPEAVAEPMAAAMDFLARTDAMILDLRKNGGGSPKGVALVCSYFFAEEPVHLNSLYWRKGDRTEEFWTLKTVAGKRYVGKDLYVLTSSRTFSGAEECAYNLQTQKRATIVGETTGGGAHPGGMVPLGERFIAFIPTGRAINPITKTNWEGTGVKADVACTADQALDVAHQAAIKKLLDAAKDDETRRLIQMDLDRAKQEAPAKAKP